MTGLVPGSPRSQFFLRTKYNRPPKLISCFSIPSLLHHQESGPTLTVTLTLLTVRRTGLYTRLSSSGFYSSSEHFNRTLLPTLDHNVLRLSTLSYHLNKDLSSLGKNHGGGEIRL